MHHGYIKDKLQLILPFIWLIVKFCLASQGSRIGDIGITENEKRRIEEADIARQVALLNERDRKRRMGKLPSPPSARHLDDGIQGDRSIMELIEGFRGLL